MERLLESRAGLAHVDAHPVPIGVDVEANRVVIAQPGVAHGVKNLAATRGRIIYLVDVQFQAAPAETDEGRLPWDFAGAGVWDVVRG